MINNKASNISPFGPPLLTNTTLTELCLNGNGITDVSVLAAGLRAQNVLTRLFLSMNKIADICELGEALAKNTSLTELRLSTNRIRDISSFVKALATNTTLKTLKLNRNRISDPSAQKLVAPLNARTQGLSLEVEGNKISDSTLRDLEKTQDRFPPPNPATEFLADLFNDDDTLRNAAFQAPPHGNRIRPSDG